MDNVNTASGRRYAYLAIGLIVLTLLVMDFNRRMTHLRNLEAEREVVKADLVTVLEQRRLLESQIEYARSEKSVEEHARVDAHMLKPGDTAVILVPGAGSDAQTAPPAVILPSEKSNPEKWLWLLTGPSP